MACPPAAEESQGTRQLPSCGRELVYEAWRALGIWTREDECLALEMTQTLAEHVGSDADDLVLEVAEAPRPVEQRRDQQQCPAISHGRERRGERGLADSFRRMGGAGFRA